MSLTPEEVALVRATLDLPDDVRERIEAAGHDGLPLGGHDIDCLVELATDRLMTHGFDEAYRPTGEGAALERLVDHLTSEDDDARGVSKQ